jgi:hypothetical protein
MMNCKDCEGHGWNEDTRGNMIVCKRCAGTGITLHPDDLAALAAANGYVKADPPITSMHDPRLGIKRPEPWHIDIDALAKSAGYIKLEPGQVLVDTKMYELTLSMAHKWERICDGEELADVAGEGE